MKRQAYVRRILIEPDPLLHKVAKKVGDLELRMPLTQQLIDDMLATMYAAPGIGLAAPQVGVAKRIVVVHVGDDPQAHAIVNPVLSDFEGEVVAPEGCLSIPGKVGDVTRAERCRVSGLERNGKKTSFLAEGMLARCFQHEVDHLDGILILDKAQNIRDAVPVETPEKEREEEGNTSVARIEA
ncbi:MAG: peptide deformylase [Candidatus Eremiobacteraeota bacterium]|nr:peptide deformylase [Candidatus Eremiobacteraeota bacterium]MBC5826129.1 peptide deformylase [Candidatus Eremiobacteraeota bacterium]